MLRDPGDDDFQSGFLGWGCGECRADLREHGETVSIERVGWSISAEKYEKWKRCTNCGNQWIR